MIHPGLDVLLAHADGELPEREASDVALHLETCAACRSAVAGIHQTAGAFAGVVHALDSVEPAAWLRAATDAEASGASGANAAPPEVDRNVLPLSPRRKSGSAPASSVAFRWAAGILLVTGSAAAAALWSDRPLPGTHQADQPTAVAAPGLQADANVALVMVEPLNGGLRVSLSGAGTGSTIHVQLTAAQAASVAVEGAESPHFTAVAGHVQLDLRSSVAAVRLTLPYGLQSATVTLDGATIITVDADVVSPPTALDGGLSLDTPSQPRIE